MSDGGLRLDRVPQSGESKTILEMRSALRAMTKPSTVRTAVLALLVSLFSLGAFSQVKTTPRALAVTVLKTRCRDVTKAGDSQVFAAIDALAKDSSSAAAEALAILNGFYLGEEPSLRVYGAMQHRDKQQMLALLKKHAPATSAITAPCKDVAMEPKMRRLAYEYAIGSIE